MNKDYIIRYTDHRGDDQEIACSSFEDAELIAQYLSNLYKNVVLDDGYYERKYDKS